MPMGLPFRGLLRLPLCAVSPDPAPRRDVLRSRVLVLGGIWGFGGTGRHRRRALDPSAVEAPAELGLGVRFRLEGSPDGF
jgi:hypothetical protein